MTFKHILSTFKTKTDSFIFLSSLSTIKRFHIFLMFQKPYVGDQRSSCRCPDEEYTWGANEGQNNPDEQEGGLVWNGDSLEDRSENEDYPKEDQKWMMTRLLASVLQHSSVLHPVPILFYVGTLIMFFISSLVIVATEIFYYCNLQVRPLNLKLA